MAVTVISGIPKSKPPKPAKKKKAASSKPQLQVHLSDEDTKRLDECVRAAQTNRPALVRRLIQLAHRDLMLYQRDRPGVLPAEQVTPANDHEVSPEAA